MPELHLVRLSAWEPYRFGREAPNWAARPLVAAWSDFAAWLAAPLPSTDKYAQPWSPLAEIKPGLKGRVNGGEAGVLALEYDDGATPELLARARALLASHDAVIYTTASATVERPRFRVVLRPSRPMDDAAYRASVDAVGALLGAPPAPESRQRTRIWYRPIEGSRPSITVHTGQAWDVDASLASHPPAPVRERHAPDPEVLARYSDDARVALARAELLRRRPAGAFAGALVLHDYAVPHPARLPLLLEYAHAVGWDDIDEDAIAERIDHASEHARHPEGNAFAAAQPAAPAPSGLAPARARLRAELFGALARSRIVALIAPMGLGKTTLAAELFTICTRALYVAPTRALVASSAAVLGGVDYREDAHRTASHVRTTAASLRHYVADLDRRGLVILDECVEGEGQIHSGITRDKRGAMAAFVDALALPGRTLLMGADLTRADVERYSQLVGQPIEIVDLSGTAVQTRTIVEVPGWRVEDEFAAELARAGPEHRAILFCDRPRELEAWRLRIANDHPALRVLTIHGKTDRKAGLAALGAGAWDVLLATHALAEGVSIEQPVAWVGVLRHDRGTGGAATTLQEIGRARAYTRPEQPILVGAPDWRPANRHTDVAVEWHERGSSAIDYRPHPIDPALAESWAAHLRRRDAAYNEPGLEAGCRARGWGWSRDLAAYASTRPRAAPLKLWRELDRAAYVAAVVAAPALDDEEAHAERRREAPDHHALARHALEAFTGAEIAGVDPEVVGRDHNGRERERLRACAHVMTAKLADAEWRREGGDVTGREAPAHRAAARRWLFELVTGCPVGSAARGPVEAWLARVPAGRVPYLGPPPKLGAGPGDLWAWLVARFRAFGVGLTRESGVATAAWPPPGLWAHYARHLGLPPSPRGRGRPKVELPWWEIEAKRAQGISLRKIAAEFGVGKDVILRHEAR